MIYKNGNIDEVYHGSTKIGEIYHGSTLVYQSKPRIQLYGWSSYLGSSYIFTNKLGTLDNNYVFIDFTNQGNPYLFKGMDSGNLGEAGSTINTSASYGYWKPSYVKTLRINGVKVHFYAGVNGYTYDTVAVIDKAEINSKVILTLATNSLTDYPVLPTAITSSTLTYVGYDGNSHTETRASAQDFVWTNEPIS